MGKMKKRIAFAHHVLKSEARCKTQGIDRDKVLQLTSETAEQLKNREFTLMEMKCFVENFMYVYEHSTMHSRNDLLNEIGIKGLDYGSGSDPDNTVMAVL